MLKTLSLVPSSFRSAVDTRLSLNYAALSPRTQFDPHGVRDHSSLPSLFFPYVSSLSDASKVRLLLSCLVCYASSSRTCEFFFPAFAWSKLLIISVHCPVQYTESPSFSSVAVCSEKYGNVGSRKFWIVNCALFLPIDSSEVAAMTSILKSLALPFLPPFLSLPLRPIVLAFNAS